MADPEEDDDEDRETHNEISDGNFNGPVGQFGSVHGDVNMSNTSNPRSQEEEEFWAQYRERKRQQWQAEEALRAWHHQQQQEQQRAAEGRKQHRDDSKIIWIWAVVLFAVFVVVVITVTNLSGGGGSSGIDPNEPIGCTLGGKPVDPDQCPNLSDMAPYLPTE